MTTNVKCTNCGANVKNLGKIQPTHIFAGKFLDKLIDGGNLYKCESCHLGFRFPRLTKKTLDDLYINGSDETWLNHENLRADWTLSYEWIRKFIPKGSTILDVGCYDGKFFEPLIDNFNCFGIEIHKSASERAIKRGVKIISTDFIQFERNFDCITVFDVIEHVENPREFLNKIYNSLLPGGICIISTGNLNSPSFKFMKSKYWYCTIAEHISFLSPSWFKSKENIKDFNLIQVKKFSRARFKLSSYFKEASLNLIFKISPWLIAVLKKVGTRSFNYNKYPAMKYVGPAWGSSNDHFVVLLQKS